MRVHRRIAVCIVMSLATACSGGAGSGSDGHPGASAVVVNSVADLAAPPAGTITLRSALADTSRGQRITFDPSLDGQTIALTIVAEPHTILKGEVMGIRNEPSGPVSYLVGYQDRDYGPSALVARKDVVIDASALPHGVTITWAGGDQPGARVLAVDGNLDLINVRITGGRSVAEKRTVTNPDEQPWTLGRGAALAVWGIARLRDCELSGNHAQGDFDSSRDRGAFGGGIYADVVDIEHCVISGNTVIGGGAAGGGVYSVGGAGHPETVSRIDRSAVTGNRIAGLFAYGAGVYSDGGSIGNSKTLRITNSTVARNLAEPSPGLPPFLLRMGYWRGGGVYMSNGSLEIQSCTIVENVVRGVARTDSLGRRNLAGGIAATVGNAHETEDMILGHSIIAGNVVQEIGGASYAHDVFTGSLFYFRSAGYNRIGVMDFSQILVPVGEPTWASLVRKHFPQDDDVADVDLADVVDLAAGISKSSSVVSAGTDAGEFAVLRYAPAGSALDRVPSGKYEVQETHGEYAAPVGTDDFLAIVLRRIEQRYALAGFGAEFQSDFESFLASVDIDAATAGNQPYTDPDGRPILTLAATHWFGPSATWPKELPNFPYIEFWHRLDAALAARAVPGLGPQLLGDRQWRELFESGPLAENPSIRMSLSTRARLTVQRLPTDQSGTARPAGAPADIGAVEVR
ncbi:MAG TPA: right-handed parallel beta-helix repeat-containing protein [Steroidobacteraceae bacterium]